MVSTFQIDLCEGLNVSNRIVSDLVKTLKFKYYQHGVKW